MRRSLLTSLSLLALTATAQAAPPRLDVRPVVGYMLSSGWQRVALRVENPADGPQIDGEATLHLRDGRVGSAANSSDWVQPLNLAPGEAKDLSFDVRLFGNSFPIVDASVVQGHGRSSATLAAQTFDALKSQPVGMLKILHVTDASARDEPFFSLNGQRLGVRASLLGRQLATQVGRVSPAERTDYRAASPARVFTLSPADAPDTTLPLSAFSAVYVDDLAPLNPAQQEALQRYVAEGGTLVTQGATETQRREGSGIVATLPNALSAWGWARTLRFGLPPEKSPMLLAPRFSLGLDDGDTSDGGWGAAGLTLKPPPFSTVALFLGVYLIVLIPVQYAVLKRLGKREWAWGVTPALALVFAGAAYGLGQDGRRRTQTHQVGSILELGNGVGRGAVLTSIGVYSPGLADAEVSVEAPEAHVWQASGGLNAPAEYRPDSRHASLRGLRLAQWSVASVSARSEATLGEGVRITASPWGTGDQNGRQEPAYYTVENRTGKRLRSVWFQGQRLGDIAPGQVRRVSTNIVAFPWNDDPLKQQMMGAADLQSKVDATGSVQAGLNALVATLDEPLVTVRIDGSDAPPQKSATMVVVRF